MGAIALALIAGALGFQYFVHLAPCEMCHWQRWPLIGAAVIGLIGIQFFSPVARALAIAAVLLVAISGAICAYQFGTQMGVLPGPSACTVAHAYVLGSNAPPPEISCNAITWSLFGLSLAAYNAIFSLGTALLGTILLMRNR